MPYIALQLVGIQVRARGAGFGGSGNWFVKDLPLFIAFAVLAAYTYSSGLRAPALIAFVKDILIYVVIIVAVIYLPHKLGGWGHIFSAASDSFTRSTRTTPTRSRRAGHGQGDASRRATAQWAYASLALGSALALFMYPHSVTGVLSTRNRGVIRRNAALLPAYSFLLGLLALLGFVAVAAGVEGGRRPAQPAAGRAAAVRERVPAVVRRRRRTPPSRSARWCRRRSCRSPPPTCSPATSTRRTSGPTPPRREEAQVSKIVSLVVKVGALVFVLALLDGRSRSTCSCSAASGSCRRSRRSWSACTRAGSTAGRCSIGWAVGMVYGTWSPTTSRRPTQAHFGGPLANFPGTETKVYIAAVAFVVNLVVTIVLTVVFRRMKVDAGVDRTHDDDYLADLADEGVEAEIDPARPAHA